MDVTARHNSMARSTLLLVLAAEAALFATLVMSYMFLRTQGSIEPFSHFGPIDLLAASLNTVVLLVSAVLAWRAEQAIRLDRSPLANRYLLATLALGAWFVAGQIFEFTHSGLRITGTVFGAAFFALISFHALHVLAGIIILALNWVRTRLGDFSARSHVAITVGVWFWFFVTAVWVVLYCILYWV